MPKEGLSEKPLKTTEAAGTLNVKIKQSYFDMSGKQNPVSLYKIFHALSYHKKTRIRVGRHIKPLINPYKTVKKRGSLKNHNRAEPILSTAPLLGVLVCVCLYVCVRAFGLKDKINMSTLHPDTAILPFVKSLNYHSTCSKLYSFTGT